MKTKLMIGTDWMASGTGFSEEMRNIAYRLVQSGEYEIYWLGFNYVGLPLDYPDSIFSDLPHTGATIKGLCGYGPGQLFGLNGFKNNFYKYNPDFYLAMGDPKVFEPYARWRYETKTKFPFVAYTTIDGVPIHPSWKPTFSQINIPLAMTEWGMNQYQKAGIPMAGYIHHGVNWEWMARSRESKRRARKIFGIDEETVLFMDWNTNQYRKRIDALLECWKAFKPETKNAKLFLYMDSDMTEPHKQMGWHLEDLMKQMDIPRETVLLPEDVFKRRKYFESAEDIDFHKMVISMADILVSCTSGEGFGKVFLEALSLGIPIICPYYSSLPEVCEKGALLIPLYDGPAGHYRVQDAVRSVYGGIVNQEKFVEAMARLYDHPDEREELGAQGREWAKDFDYDTQIIPGWMNILGSVNPDVIYAQELLGGVM